MQNRLTKINLIVIFESSSNKRVKKEKDKNEEVRYNFIISIN